MTAFLEEQEKRVRDLERTRERPLRHHEIDEELLGRWEIVVAFPRGVEVLARAPDQRMEARARGGRAAVSSPRRR
jgi:hypothetical protein